MHFYLSNVSIMLALNNFVFHHPFNSEEFWLPAIGSAFIGTILFNLLQSKNKKK
jgi:hypothetical protein